MAADEKPTAESVSEQTAPKPSGDNPALSVGRIVSEADAVFGGSFDKNDVAGAFAGVADDKEVTISDARKRVQSYLKAEVSVDTGTTEE